MSLLNKKYLFVHINKSGGGIITKNMETNGNVELTGYHRSLSKMISLIPKEKHNQLYIFTVVRNPWDRMISLYFYYKDKNYHSEFFSGDPEIDNDFNKWIKYIYSDKFDKTRIHSDVNVFTNCFSNQLNWLKDKNENIMRINKILKFENMKSELNDFLKTKLQLKNIIDEKVHPTNHDHYSKYYNEESKELVRLNYKEDIDFFGYAFEKI